MKRARIANGGGFLGARPLPQDRIGYSARRTAFAGPGAQGSKPGDPMRIRRITISVAFAAGLATLPLSAAKAQYYRPYSPPPLSWPICAVGAVVVSATAIFSAPLRALTGAPPFYYVCYGPSPYYPPPAYPAPGYYAPPNYSGPR